MNSMDTALRMEQKPNPYIQSCPDGKAGSNSSGVEGVEQGHFVHTVCGGKLLFSDYGPGKMA